MEERIPGLLLVLLSAACVPEQVLTEHRRAIQEISTNGICRYGSIVDCCWGWTRESWGHCRPVCELGCKHGECVGAEQCRCHQGYMGKTCNQVYVNECGLKPRPCKHRCVNLVGSYKCFCLAGYMMTHDGTCRNTRTCAMANCQYGCAVMKGEVMCQCPSPGLWLSTDRRTCVDIDECAMGVAKCPRFRKCVNTFGSYICKCHKGFELHYINGKYQCTDKNNPCHENPDSKRCRCKPGARGWGYDCKIVITVTVDSARPLTTRRPTANISKATLPPTPPTTTKKQARTTTAMATTTTTATTPSSPMTTTTTTPTTVSTTPAPTTTSTTPAPTTVSTTTAPTTVSTTPAPTTVSTTTAPTTVSTTTAPTTVSTTPAPTTVSTTTAPTTVSTTTAPTTVSTTTEPTTISTTTAPTTVSTTPAPTTASTTTAPTTVSTTTAPTTVSTTPAPTTVSTTTAPTTVSTTTEPTTISTTTAPTTVSTTTAPTTVSTTTAPTTVSTTTAPTTISTTTEPTTVSTTPAPTTVSTTTEPTTVSTTPAPTTISTTTAPTTVSTTPAPTTVSTTTEPTTISTTTAPTTVSTTTVTTTVTMTIEPTTTALSTRVQLITTTLDNHIREITQRPRGDVHIPKNPDQNVFELGFDDIELGNAADFARDDSAAGSLSCSFDQGVCSWMTDRDGDLRWELVSDPHGGRYLTVPDINTGGRFRGARLTIPLAPPTSPLWKDGDLCLAFKHCLQGLPIGSLQVFVKKGWGYSPAVWTRTSGHGWRHTQLTLRGRGIQSVVFKGERRKGRSGEIAIDDVSIHTGVCSNIG